MSVKEISNILSYLEVLEFGGKEKDDERVSFYLLLAPVMHRGERNRCGKKWRRAQSMADRTTTAVTATAIETKP